MRSLADVPISRATLGHLNDHGHDAISVLRRLPATASDSEIIHLALAEERVILCFDLDFCELVALSGESLPSVVTLRTTKHHPLYVNQRLDEILPLIVPDLMHGALATVEDTRVRVRMLPINPRGQT